MNFDEIILSSDFELMGIDPVNITTDRYPNLRFYVGDTVEILFTWDGRSIVKGTIQKLRSHRMGVIFPYDNDCTNGILIEVSVKKGGKFKLISCGEGTPSLAERLGIGG